jgi:hypothetical protein
MYEHCILCFITLNQCLMFLGYNIFLIDNYTWPKSKKLTKMMIQSIDHMKGMVKEKRKEVLMENWIPLLGQ